MSLRTTRRALLAGTGVSLAGLAGCLGGGGGGGESTGSGDPTGTSSRTASDDGETPASDAGASANPATDAIPVSESRLPVQYEFDFLDEQTVSGGPPKDGIPSVDDPKFWDVAGADDFLDDGDVVFGVVRNGEVKAYPQRVLVWHEITNDTVGGDPVSVTYCPLTGTAMGFERGESTFGVSGRLVNSNLVMYDRATDSRWPQVLATAITGAFRGRSLVEFPVTWTTWGQWKTAHPDTTVLSTDTSYARNYSRDPYGAYNPRRGYYSNSNTLFGPLTRDERFDPKEVVIGARTTDGPVAFVKDALREAGVLTADVGGVEYVAVYDESLDTAHVYRNPDGKTVKPTEDGVTVDGQRYAVVSLPLEGVVDLDAMWFAWVGFYPETAVANA